LLCGIFSKLKDFSGFVRLRLSFFGSFFGVVGYIMFNPLSLNLIPVFLGCFCTLALLFSCKKIRDIRAGLIKDRPDALATRKTGILLLVIIFLIGFVSSLYLSYTSLFFYSSMVFIAVAYGFFRLNMRSSSHLYKNLYAAFGLPLLFLFGAGTFNLETIFYYLLFFILLFPGAMIADLRDYKEDIITGKKTVPTVIGYAKSKALVCSILSVFALLVFSLYIIPFVLFGMFSLLMVLLVSMNRPNHAHLSGAVSFPISFLWILVTV